MIIQKSCPLFCQTLLLFLHLFYTIIINTPETISTEMWHTKIKYILSYDTNLWGMVAWKIVEMQLHVLSQTSSENLWPLHMTRFSRQFVPDLASCSLSAVNMRYKYIWYITCIVRLTNIWHIMCIVRLTNISYIMCIVCLTNIWDVDYIIFFIAITIQTYIHFHFILCTAILAGVTGMWLTHQRTSNRTSEHCSRIILSGSVDMCFITELWI